MARRTALQYRHEQMDTCRSSNAGAHAQLGIPTLLHDCSACPPPLLACSKCPQRSSMHTGVVGIHRPGPAAPRTLGTATQALCGLHTGISSILHCRSLQQSAFHTVSKATGLEVLRWQQSRQLRSSTPQKAARAPCVGAVAFMAQPKFGRTIVQEAKGVHAATVFIMHGLGDSGEGLSHIGPSLAMPHVKFICKTQQRAACLLYRNAERVFALVQLHLMRRWHPLS
jgi:Phospholipase/Carboxylesterase